MASNVYDFNLPAAIGGTYVLNVQGNQALVKSAAGGTVELLTEKGERYVCDEGQGFQLPEGQTFRQLRIVNRQAVANAGLIFVGDDTFIDKRITGSVKVIDQGADKTAAGAQFYGSSSRSSAQFPIAGIQAGTKTMYIKRLTITATAAGQCFLMQSTTAPILNPVAGGTFLNKLGGGANSQAARVAGDSVAGGVPVASEVAGVIATAQSLVYVNANAYQELVLTTPLAIPPGRVLIVVGGAANSSVTMMADFEEV